MSQDTFETDWQNIKYDITFQYDLREFDPEIKEIKKFLSDHDSDLKKIIFENSEIFWRQGLGPKQKARFSFFYKVYNLEIQYQHYNMPQWLFISCQSEKLKNEQEKIYSDYLTQSPISLKKLIEKVKEKSQKPLPKAKFEVEIPDLAVENLTKILHFTADPKIAQLVVALNRIGVRTDNSCEGHNDRGAPDSPLRHTTVGFPNHFLLPLLSHLENWEEVTNPDILIKNFAFDGINTRNERFDMVFNTESLEEGQKLANSLANYLEKNSKKSPANPWYN